MACNPDFFQTIGGTAIDTYDTDSSNKAADWYGSVDVVVGQAFTDGAAGVVSGITASTFGDEPTLFVPGGTIFALLEARGAYTPVANETFTLTIEADGGN